MDWEVLSESESSKPEEGKEGGRGGKRGKEKIDGLTRSGRGWGCGS